jgi:hypothetical protein
MGSEAKNGIDVESPLSMPWRCWHFWEWLLRRCAAEDLFNYETGSRNTTMTYMNGIDHAEIAAEQEEVRDEFRQIHERKNQPASVIRCGAVETRIWANPTNWGAVTFRVDQVRGRRSRSFGAHDLADAWRGLYRAQKWIRKMEKRMTPRRFFWNPF